MPAPITPPSVGDMLSPDGLPIAQPDKVVAPSQSAAPVLPQEPAPQSTPPASTTNEPFNGPEPKQPLVDDDTFNVDAFAEAGLHNPVTTKKEEPKTTPAAKPAAPVTEPPAKPAAPAAPANPNARDYTGIPDDLKPVFERMSNEAFAKTKEIYTEREALKTEKARLDADLKKAKEGALPDSYYEHEDAFMLTPEFANLSIGVSQYQTIASHWEKQQMDVASGADTYQEIHFDPKSQQFYLGQPIKVDRTTEVLLNRNAGWANQELANRRAQLNALGTVHKTRAGEAKQWLNNFDSKAFAVFNDDTKPLKAMVADSRSKMLHPAFHGNPLADVLVKALLTIQIMNANKTQAAPAAGANGNAPAAPTKQPTAAEIAGGGAAPTPKGAATDDVSVDDFEAVKLGVR